MDLKSLWEAAKIVESESTVQSTVQRNIQNEISLTGIQESTHRSFGSSRKSSLHRINHNNLEKCRRAFLRDCLCNLKAHIPRSSECSKSTTLSLLLTSKEYLLSLQKNSNDLENSIMLACKRFFDLKKTIFTLIGEFKDLKNESSVSNFTPQSEICKNLKIKINAKPSNNFHSSPKLESVIPACKLETTTGNQQVKPSNYLRSIDSSQFQYQNVQISQVKRHIVPKTDFSPSMVCNPSAYNGFKLDMHFNQPSDHLYSFDTQQKSVNHSCYDAGSDSGLSIDGISGSSHSSCSCSSSSPSIYSFESNQHQNKPQCCINHEKDVSESLRMMEQEDNEEERSENDEDINKNSSEDESKSLCWTKKQKSELNLCFKSFNMNRDSQVRLEVKKSTRKRDRLYSLNEESSFNRDYDKKIRQELSNSLSPKKSRSWIVNSYSL